MSTPNFALRALGAASAEGRCTTNLEIAYCILDVDATDTDGARALLRLHLPELGAPSGTLVQFGQREDRYDGALWHLNECRSIDE